LALAASTQNLFLLYLLQTVVSPGVQSFCIFASVAIVFDFFFHLMFFVAVLHVEVRRMELQDSIDRTALQSSLRQRARMQRRYWFDAFLQGQTPVMTRIAGSAVSICFVLFLNVHFSGSDSIGRSLIRFLMNPILPPSNHDSSAMFSSSPINSARTPQTWFSLQDYQSAREVVFYVKPQAHVLIARIYEPLVLVFKGSDRSHVPLQENVIWKFCKVAQGHVYMFILVLISIVGVVTLLMQYLLWNEIPNEEPSSTSAATFNIKRIPGRFHTLDIYKVFTNARGQILVLDLDRNVVLYTLDESQQVYHPTVVQDHQGNKPTWTNDAVRIDEHGRWFAAWTPKGMIELWNLTDMTLATKFQSFSQPLLVEFAYLEPYGPQVLSMSTVGYICRWNVNGAKLGVTKIQTKSTFKFAILEQMDGAHCIIAVDSDGEVHIASLDLSTDSSTDEAKSTRVLHEMDPRLVHIKRMDRARRVSYVSDLTLFTIQRAEHVDLVHSETGLLIHRIPIPEEHIPVSNLRLTYTPPRACRLCESPSVAVLSIAYTSKTKRCVVQTFTRDDMDEDSEMMSLMCLRSTGNFEAGTCKGIPATGHMETMDNDTGAWDVTNSQVIVGVRRKRPNSDNSRSKGYASGVSAGFATPMSLRSRRSEREEHKLIWELWCYDTVTGAMAADCLTSGLDSNTNLSTQDLLVTEPGPVASVGKRTVLITMGIVLRAVTIGGDRIELRDVEEPKRPTTLRRLGSGLLESKRRRGLVRSAS
jgi:hypothetical protein